MNCQPPRAWPWVWISKNHVGPRNLFCEFVFFYCGHCSSGDPSWSLICSEAFCYAKGPVWRLTNLWKRMRIPACILRMGSRDSSPLRQGPCSTLKRTATQRARIHHYIDPQTNQCTSVLQKNKWRLGSPSWLPSVQRKVFCVVIVPVTAWDVSYGHHMSSFSQERLLLSQGMLWWAKCTANQASSHVHRSSSMQHFIYHGQWACYYTHVTPCYTRPAGCRLQKGVFMVMGSY